MLALGPLRSVHSVRQHEHRRDWLEQLRDDGFPVTNVKHPPEAPGPLSAGFGLLGLINKGPHPNAAKVLVNWLASKEGMAAWSKNEHTVPVRSDIEPTFVNPETIPDPNVEYFDTYEYEFVLTHRMAVIRKLSELLS